MKAYIKTTAFSFEDYPDSFENKDGYVLSSLEFKYNKEELIIKITPVTKDEITMVLECPMIFSISFLDKEDEDKFNSLKEKRIREKIIEGILD